MEEPVPGPTTGRGCQRMPDPRVEAPFPSLRVDPRFSAGSWHESLMAYGKPLTCKTRSAVLLCQA